MEEQIQAIMEKLNISHDQAESLLKVTAAFLIVKEKFVK